LPIKVPDEYHTNFSLNSNCFAEDFKNPGICLAMANYSLWHYLNYKPSLRCLWDSQSAESVSYSVNDVLLNWREDAIKGLVWIASNLQLAGGHTGVRDALLYKLAIKNEPEVLILSPIFNPLDLFKPWQENESIAHAVVVIGYKKISSEMIEFYCYDVNFPRKNEVIYCVKSFGKWILSAPKYPQYYLFLTRYIGDSYDQDFENIFQGKEKDNWCDEHNPAPTGKIPDTGQMTCYDDVGNTIPCPPPGQPFYGQDANYSINPQSYTKIDDNGNDLPDSAASWAMVRDNVTGLIWENKTDDGSIHDKDNYYTWYQVQGSFIAQLNAQNFGGHNDWRLPTVMELSMLVNAGRIDPAINTSYLQNTMPPLYWSSTIDAGAGNPDVAWMVNFYYGDVYASYVYDDYGSHSQYVRAVRGGQ
jgi:hypothetical protein